MTEPELHPWLGLRPFRRHSLVLMVCGSVYIMIGIAYLTTKPTQERLVSLEYLLWFLNYNDWGWVWIGAGALAIISSRWPPVSETWGYQALTGMACLWAGAYFASVQFGDSPNSTISGFLSWGLIAFLWWAISGLVNPEAMLKYMKEIFFLRSEIDRLEEENRALKSRGE